MATAAAEPPGGPAGDAVQAPGIAHGTPIRYGGRGAGIEFVHIALADEDRAGIFQAADGFGVFSGESIFIDGAGRGCADSCSVDAVLDADRDAVKGAAERSSGLLLFEDFGLCEGFFAQHGDPGIGFGLIGPDAIKAGVGKFDGRDFFGADEIGGLFEGEGREVVRGGSGGEARGDGGGERGGQEVAAR